MQCVSFVVVVACFEFCRVCLFVLLSLFHLFLFCSVFTAYQMAKKKALITSLACADL